MPNWWDRNYDKDQSQKVRYRATVPVDVWIESTNIIFVGLYKS